MPARGACSCRLSPEELRGWPLSASSIGAASNESSHGVRRATTSARALRADPRPEPGSFRDRQSRVFYDEGGEVLRFLSEEGLDDWQALAASTLYSRFSDAGLLVSTQLVDKDESVRNGWSGVLRHERVPFISYPYEWTFSMLKDAALLQLDLVLAGLDEGLILKDASPYNVQWRGARPVFIDIGSFERLRSAEPWAGYRQFCMLYLYPLLLEAYRGIPFQPLLRGSLEGVEPSVSRRHFSLRDFARRGVLTHVVLHERLERRYGNRGGEVRRELEAAGFGTELIKANVGRLRKLVARLEPSRTESTWSGYGSCNTYSDEESQRKAEVVRATARALQPKLVWDIGCNDGRYSRVAAEHAQYIVAIDADRTTVDRVYRSLAADGEHSILPLVVDVADPSPALGWRNLERKTLVDRGTPDLTLCLAIVHHLAITRNIPLRSFLEWLRSLDSVILIEFPHEDDPMVRVLLDAKRPGTHDDYSRANFERALSDLFIVESSVALSGTRTMYRAQPRQ
jgi:SAM-dependent methyltransferase